VEGGVITLRAKRGNGRLIVEVIDDGVGIPEQRQTEVYGSGIGISNVRERLKVLYGQDFLLRIDSKPGKGTSIRLEIPELVTTLPAEPVEPPSVSS
jgi:two-component system LytT family sensor kinase